MVQSSHLGDCSLLRKHHRRMATRGALIRVASKGHLEALEELLQPDPAGSLKEAEFTLPKLSVVAACHHQLEILKYCISIGANINDDAMRIGPMESNHLNAYKTVIIAGFEINYDHDGTVGGLLIRATLADYIPLAAYLLDHGAEVNRDRQNGVYRPLATAAQRNNVEMLELLIEYGAQIDRSGALIVAAEQGSLEAVRC